MSNTIYLLNREKYFIFLIITFIITSCSNYDVLNKDPINIVDVNDVTINVTAAGTLPSLIPLTKKDLITKLKLTGNLNGTDIEYIREMAGNSGSLGGSTTNGQLAILDLSDANIVAGGYYSSFGNTFTTSLNVITNDAFAGCLRLDSVIIPNNVISIGSFAFLGCTGLTSITIPNGVTSIGDRAFSGCTGLSSIVIPNNVTTIGNYAFSGCTELSSLTIGKRVTTIGDFAFKDCTISLLNFNPTDFNSAFYNTFNFQSSLKILNIGENVKTIASSLFSGCTGLTSITIPNSVTSIGSSAFSDCTGLSSVNIGDSTTSIGNGSFTGCTRLYEFIVSENNIKYCSLNGVLFNKNITELIVYPNAKSNIYTIPSSVTSIKDYAFASCKRITSITIPNSVTSIGSSAFLDCSELSSLTIGNGVTSIGSDAFSRCTKLTSITIPNSVTSIGELAFGNTGLTSVTIPNSVTLIGKLAFSCATLVEFIVSENNSTYCSLDGVLFNKNNTELIAYPKAKPNSYNIPSSVTSIKDYAFASCKRITSITIPNSVTSIGSSAFFGCTGLSSIIIPNNVTIIGRYAFSGCSGIREIHCKTLTPPNITTDTFEGIDKNTCKLYIPKGSYSNYWGTTGWGDFKNIINE